MKTRCVLLAASLLCVSFPCRAADPAPAPYRFQNVTFIAGGFITGFVAHPAQRGLYYVSTDIGGAYRWDNTTRRWSAGGLAAVFPTQPAGRGEHRHRPNGREEAVYRRRHIYQQRHAQWGDPAVGRSGPALHHRARSLQDGRQRGWALRRGTIAGNPIVRGLF